MTSFTFEGSAIEYVIVVAGFAGLGVIETNCLCFSMTVSFSVSG